jgi:hypothetical protein
MRARNLAPATVRTYGTGARQLLDWHAANAPEVTTAEQVRRSDCKTFLIELMTRGSASTAKTRHTGMSRFVALLVEEDELPRSPNGSSASPWPVCSRRSACRLVRKASRTVVRSAAWACVGRTASGSRVWREAAPTA